MGPHSGVRSPADGRGTLLLSSVPGCGQGNAGLMHQVSRTTPQRGFSQPALATFPSREGSSQLTPCRSTVTSVRSHHSWEGATRLRSPTQVRRCHSAHSMPLTENGRVHASQRTDLTGWTTELSKQSQPRQQGMKVMKLTLLFQRGISFSDSLAVLYLPLMCW